jgi:CheY-like chemotaxis protein
MRFLVVEDDRKIKTETIDDCLASLGCASDWAMNQQEANEFLVVCDYDLILLDLKIPARLDCEGSPDYGANLLKQIRMRSQRRVPVILMTGQHQQCVDLTDTSFGDACCCLVVGFKDTNARWVIQEWLFCSFAYRVDSRVVSYILGFEILWG